MKKRGFGAGKWNGVGGKLEPNESLVDALVRECEEEIGVTPTDWTAVAELDFIQDAETDEPWHMFVYAYIADSWEGEPSESEEMRPQWFNIADIPYDQMWDDDEHWLPQVLSGQKINGKFTFDINDRLLTHKVIQVKKLTHEAAA
jgi:8-oxo-dGTP pyrophosphatase MutT (NUDIX family)